MVVRVASQRHSLTAHGVLYGSLRIVESSSGRVSEWGSEGSGLLVSGNGKFHLYCWEETV